jgi:muramoyltetrapeptide carboxypeptidase
MSSRRVFLKQAGMSALAAPLMGQGIPRTLRKPPRLRPGDTVGIFSPAGVVLDRTAIDFVRQLLWSMGLESKVAPHAMDEYGYLAGQDVDRAADINALFADPSVKALLATRGGWGCARTLPYLDYPLIRRNPKIIIGFSDLTALLLGIHAQTGLITFHGPVVESTWNDFSIDYFRRVLMDGEAVAMQETPAAPVADTAADTVVAARPVRQPALRTIHPGTATGPLLGGNLTVLCHILGSPYMPHPQNAVLFVEDIGEYVYRVDRMLTHLHLAGVMGSLAAFIFGDCRDCDPEPDYPILSLDQVLDDHLRSLSIPAFVGASIGHIRDKYTLPIGLPVEVDARAGLIRLTEAAVV